MIIKNQIGTVAIFVEDGFMFCIKKASQAISRHYVSNGDGTKSAEKFQYAIFFDSKDIELFPIGVYESLDDAKNALNELLITIGGNVVYSL